MPKYEMVYPFCADIGTSPHLKTQDLVLPGVEPSPPLCGRVLAPWDGLGRNISLENGGTRGRVKWGHLVIVFSAGKDAG